MKTSQTHRNYKLNTGTSNKTCQCPPAAQIVRPVISEIRNPRPRSQPLDGQEHPHVNFLGWSAILGTKCDDWQLAKYYRNFKWPAADPIRRVYADS